MKHAAIPVDLFNKIVEYLGSRPYNEVASAIEEVRTSARIVDLDEEEEVSNED